MTTTNRLTILSANLKNPFFRLGRVNWPAVEARLAAFARLAEAAAADVLLLQEVGRRGEFRVDNWLSEQLGLVGLYERANRAFGAEEGVAILSRYPLLQPAVCVLAGGLWRRPALGAVVGSPVDAPVDAPMGEVAVFTVHLSLRPWRNRGQPAALRAWVAATAGERAAVIGGDFNAHETAPHIAALRAEWIDVFRATRPTADGTTHTLRPGPWLPRRWALNRRLDYIYLRPGESVLRIADCDHRARADNADPPFSDHRAVVARFVAGGG